MFVHSGDQRDSPLPLVASTAAEPWTRGIYPSNWVPRQVSNVGSGSEPDERRDRQEGLLPEAKQTKSRAKRKALLAGRLSGVERSYWRPGPKTFAPLLIAVVHRPHANLGEGVRISRARQPRSRLATAPTSPPSIDMMTPARFPISSARAADSSPVARSSNGTHPNPS